MVMNAAGNKIAAGDFSVIEVNGAERTVGE